MKIEITALQYYTIQDEIIRIEEEKMRLLYNDPWGSDFLEGKSIN